MTGITAACTCSVDGWSGNANTRYNGYSFTGCGAHVDYTLDSGSGAGYERVWCYVTSPPDCTGASPYIPEGLKTDNTLPEWEADGAAWKECYDGYRCEAWWGSLEGPSMGEPVVLDAPLDWPDCCALCSNSGGDGTTTTGDECEAWSFDPLTGSCQLMSAVQSMFADNSWAVNSTVHGYPGYFEAPITDCWSRTQYDLCVNTNVALIIPGVIVAFISLCCVYFNAFQSPWKNSGRMGKLLADPQSARLVKAACVKVSCTKVVTRGAKGRTRTSYCYEGTFITRAGALFTRPRSRFGGRYSEKKMLEVLFSTSLSPKSDPAVARRCETPDGLKSEFERMAKGVSYNPVRHGTETRSSPEQDIASRRFDCLLLIGRGWRTEWAEEVLLVGILGEDRIICVDTKTWGGKAPMSFCCLFIAAATLIILCITLLTNKAAQNMARWTFYGDHRAGAVVGLVLCVSIPLTLFAWTRYRGAKHARLIEEAFSIEAEVDPTPRI